MGASEYGIFVKKNDNYVLIRDGFINRDYAYKRAKSLEVMFLKEKEFEVKTYVIKIKRG